MRSLAFALLALSAAACSGKLDVGSNQPVGPDGKTLPTLRPASQVLALGTGHGCALLEDATVACWGFNAAGQVGLSPEASLHDDSGYPYIDRPRRVEGLADVIQVSADWQTTCALTRGREVYCWGALRTFNPAEDEKTLHVPKKVPGLSDVVEVRTGGGPACALIADGSVWCWGLNDYRSVGRSATPPDKGSPMNEVLPPTRVEGITDAVAIAVSDDLSCAVHKTKEVSCWGRVEIVEDEYVPDSEVPVKVPNLKGVVQLALAQSSAIALMEDGRVVVFGGGAEGQGILRAFSKETDPTVSSYHDAVPPTYYPGLSDIVQVAAQYHTMCVLRRDGAVLCWGDNYSGELGTGKRNNVPVLQPTLVPGVAAQRLAVGTWNSCVETAAPDVVCWGEANDGALGTDKKPAHLPAKAGDPVILPAPLAR